jgi:cysteinyl-tRNA synthetase
LKIFNTLSRQKIDFQPIEPGHVRLYVCGMTVYDYCHVGHARVLVVFDMVRRWLESQGYRVTYVRNITDIDDKIIARAVQNNEPIAALTDRFIQAMQQDAQALGVLPPTHEPRATAYVPQMLSMIDRLVDNGFAYQDANDQGEPGDVHFAVRQFPSYGALSGKSIDELRAGERVAVARDKRDPLDFVLWKRAKVDEPSDAVWSSGYGLGRPGWHIECSAMSCELLGPHFDIHGGGADLQFPHHENEIAQSEGAYRSQTHQPFVNTWMHNGFVRIDDEKMSKSLGNFFTIREVLERFDPEVVRFFILRAHYRSPLNYSDAALEESRAGLLRLYTALEKAGLESEWSDEQGHAQMQAAMAASHGQVVAFSQAMDDDFNTPEAIAALFGLATEVNRLVAAGEGEQARALAHTLRGLACSLGLLARSASVAKRAGGQGQSGGSVGLDESQIEALIVERIQAKKSKDFARADGIRAELLAQGIVLEDGPAGTTWRRA